MSAKRPRIDPIVRDFAIIVDKELKKVRSILGISALVTDDVALLMAIMNAVKVLERGVPKASS